MADFTHKFFTFPAKIYDKATVKSMIRDEEETKDIVEPGWTEGWYSVPFSEIRMWMDDTINDRELAEILENGFDSVIVNTYTAGTLECLWNRKRFEAELNKQYNDYLKEFPDMNHLTAISKTTNEG